MLLQFYCPQIDWYGWVCEADDEVLESFRGEELHCCKGEMCNDISIEDENFKPDVLAACEAMNMNNPLYKIDCSALFKSFRFMIFLLQ